MLVLAAEVDQPLSNFYVDQTRSGRGGGRRRVRVTSAGSRSREAAAAYWTGRYTSGGRSCSTSR